MFSFPADIIETPTLVYYSSQISDGPNVNYPFSFSFPFHLMIQTPEDHWGTCLREKKTDSAVALRWKMTAGDWVRLSAAEEKWIGKKLVMAVDL